MKKNSAEHLGLFLLRLVAGALFATHGGQKLLGWFGGFMGHAGATAPMGTRLWFAGVIELVGGTLLALGLFTRPVAFLAAGEMAVAYFTVHFPRGLLPIQNGGAEAVLNCFIFFYLVFRGGGEWSFDGALSRRRR